MLNIKHPAIPHQAEAPFPPRLPRWLTGRWLLFPLLGPLAPVLATAAPAQTPPTAVQQTLLTGLTELAQTALTQQIASQGWQQTQSAVKAWLPAGSAHLPPCQQPVRMNRSNPAAPAWGTQNYLLQCDDHPGWKTRGEVRVTLTLPVWVAAQGLDKQHALVASDLRAQVMEVTDLRRSFTPASQPLTGYRTLRRMNAGELLSPDRLGAPLAVHKGDPVTIYAREAGFSASTQGEADADGSLGDIIPVHNLATGKRIRAQITADHEVETRY